MSRGHDRERAVKEQLEQEGWVVIRAAGSLGGIDLAAVRVCLLAEPYLRVSEVRLIEVKSTAGGPYERFGPQERAALLAAAERAGAVAWLAYWPPRGRLRWIHWEEWPR